MINFIGVRNFKSLKNANFPLGNLTLFSGLNGMGKSSLIQTLLLLRQSQERGVLEKKGLLLNGEYLNLGSGTDVLSIVSDTDEITFTLTWDDQKPTHFVFAGNHKSDLLPNAGQDGTAGDTKLSLFNTQFQYLSAERIGPRNHHQLSEFHIRDLKSLGNQGEYTVHFLAANNSKDLPIAALRHSSSPTNALLSNVEGWMSEITPGLKIRVQVHEQFNSATLNYAFSQGKEVTQQFKPQNVGFGLSYVLPVITSILSAQKGDLLIIENPESHLHPAGQSILGRLCAMAANEGVQILVESRSDHFLNGVRVAVKEGVIPHNDVQLFFLERNSESALHISDVSNPQIDENGRLSHWPDGFFDESDNLLERLL